MRKLLVRKSYLNIPCTTSTVGAQIRKFQQAKTHYLSSAITNVGSSLEASAWHEFKVGTHGGRQVLMLVEVCTDSKAFWCLDAINDMILHQSVRPFHIKSDKRQYSYRLFNYTPFRTDDYQAYKRAHTSHERQVLISRRLTTHLQDLAYRLQMKTASSVEPSYLQLLREKKIRLGGVLQLSFDLQFRINLFIPEFLGLGRGAAMGLGVIRPMRRANSSGD